MAIKETYKQVRELLGAITQDLDKAENGNKAAAQRVRTGTVRLEKLAKLYRKESIKTEKANKGQRKPSKKAASSAPAKSAKGKAAPAKAPAQQAKVKAKPKAKAHKATARPHALSLRKPTAKLPSRRSASR